MRRFLARLVSWMQNPGRAGIDRLASLAIELFASGFALYLVYRADGAENRQESVPFFRYLVNVREVSLDGELGWILILGDRGGAEPALFTEELAAGSLLGAVLGATVGQKSAPVFTAKSADGLITIFAWKSDGRELSHAARFLVRSSIGKAPPKHYPTGRA